VTDRGGGVVGFIGVDGFGAGGVVGFVDVDGAGEAEVFGVAGMQRVAPICRFSALTPGLASEILWTLIP